MELGLKELKVAMMMPIMSVFLVLFILILMCGGFTATSAGEVSSVKGLLTTEEGQRLYNEIWKKPIQDVYEETHINIHIAWVIVPSVMIDNALTIEYERAKEILMLSIEKNEEGYVSIPLQEYIEKLIKEPEFTRLDIDDLKRIIESNEENGDAVTIGNIPNDLNHLLQLNLSLPIKEWKSIYDVGMYKPFDSWQMHYGMDIAVPVGTPIYAAADAVVEDIYYSDTGGNTVIIRNGNLIMVYCHMRELSFKKIGDKVKSGDKIGYSGATGKVTGPHLHFETWYAEIKNVRDGFGVENEIFFNPKLLWQFK